MHILRGSTRLLPLLVTSISVSVRGFGVNTGLVWKKKINPHSFVAMPPRRSARIRASSALSGVSNEEKEKEELGLSLSSSSLPVDKLPAAASAKKRRRSATVTTSAKTKRESKKKASNDDTTTTTTTTTTISCLPRTREVELKLRSELAQQSVVQYVMGIDEAGRGPLAGPVVVAAILAPSDIAGVVDSKQIKKEEDREALYEALVAMKDVRWAISVIDAARIDEINILQATLEGMRIAATALVDPNLVTIPIVSEASIQETGCYVVCSPNVSCSTTTNGKNPKAKAKSKSKTSQTDEPQDNHNPYYALVDGNKVPKDMPCPAESIVKGDSKEFGIGAASILAKVTRDRMMRGYDALYPDYNLKQHKGYPTAAHMKAVSEHGASPIHRRTFAPLKHMEFDKHGKIVVQQDDRSKN
jgi:ribonuclease HII